MTFTPQTWLTLVLAAGSDYSWPTAGARPHTDIRTGLFAYLKDYAGSVCAFCGEYDNNGEACHIVSGGDNRRGYVPSNLAYGCRDCNELDAERGPIVNFDTILRPDLIPTQWPTNIELRKIGKGIKAQEAAKKEARKAKRGM